MNYLENNFNIVLELEDLHSANLSLTIYRNSDIVKSVAKSTEDLVKVLKEVKPDLIVVCYKNNADYTQRFLRLLNRLHYLGFRSNILVRIGVGDDAQNASLILNLLEYFSEPKWKPNSSQQFRELQLRLAHEVRSHVICSTTELKASCGPTATKEQKQTLNKVLDRMKIIDEQILDIVSKLSQYNH